MKNIIKFGITMFTMILIMTGCDEIRKHNTETTNEDTEMNTVTITNVNDYTHMEETYSDEDTEMNTITITNVNDYTYMEGRFPDRVWDKTLINQINSSPQSSSDNVSTADMAISIATVEFEKLQREGIYNSHCLSGVFFDVEDQIWIVWFAEQSESADVIVVGNCYNIAISKNSGQIIKTWSSE